MLGSLDGCESSVAGCHDAGNRVHINLFSDVPRLDDLLLAGYSDQVVRANLPPVHLDPGANSIFLNQAQQFAQHRFLNGLCVNLLPEDLELTHLEQVSKVEQCLHLRLVQHLLTEETLAKNEVGVGKV